MPEAEKRPNSLLALLLVLVIGCLIGAIWTHVNLTNDIESLLADLQSGEFTVRAVVQEPPSPVWELRVAVEDASRFVNANLQTVASFNTPHELLEFGVQQAEVDGLFCEFGVFSGTTINLIASKTDATVHGFDSFEGLPDKWREGFDKGTFKRDGLPEVRDNVILYKGWFDDTVPDFVEQFPGQVSFLHMDADMYSSTRTVFDAMGDQIVAGTVIVFDEYLFYPGWQLGEFKAFHEMVEERAMTFEYIGRVIGNEQVAVKISGVGVR